MIQEGKIPGPYASLVDAKAAGAVPPNATKESHPTERELFKTTTLAVQYCMGVKSLAQQLNVTEIEAKDMLNKHKKTFSKFWEWSDAITNYIQLKGMINTVFDWRLHYGCKTKATTCRNFPVQANAAEMMRLAAIFSTEKNIQVCCPVHDAFLIEAPLDEIDEKVALTQQLMEKAGRIILNGFTIKSDVEIIRYPERYADKRGTDMWETVTGLLQSYQDYADSGIRTDSPA